MLVIIMFEDLLELIKVISETVLVTKITEDCYEVLKP